MLAGNRLGFHAVVSHRIASSEGDCRHRALASGVHDSAERSLLFRASRSQPPTPPVACGHGA
jgi:hypothetical protein